jgi:hypothetical protein
MGKYRSRPVRVFAGTYRELVRFEQISYETDEGGGRQEVWTTFIDNVGASVEPFDDPELFSTMALKPTSACKVYCHSFPGLDSSMRMFNYVDGLFYNIVSVVDEDSDNRELQILAVYRKGQWV